MNSFNLSNRGTEIAVVGGGPSGAVCAIALARGGVNVSLILRDEPCRKGVELISGQARKMLERFIAADLWTRTKAVEVTETVSIWGDREPQTWNAIYNPHGAGMAVERATFDRALRDRAVAEGVRLLSGFNVQRVLRANASWQLNLVSRQGTQVVRAGQLILATGRNSADLLGRRPSLQANGLVLTASAASPTSASRYALHLELMQHGWWYALPHPCGGTFLGYCAASKHEGRARGTLEAILREKIRETCLMRSLARFPRRALRVQACATGTRAFESVCGPAWISVGDAAFSPDPLSGVGCEFAIASGCQAASCILSGGTIADLEEYRCMVHDLVFQHRRHGLI